MAHSHHTILPIFHQHFAHSRTQFPYIGAHLYPDPQLPYSSQELLMIIPAMSDIPSHIHQRLLSEYLPIFPPSNLHHLTLIPDLDQSIMQSPSLKQT